MKPIGQIALLCVALTFIFYEQIDGSIDYHAEKDFAIMMGKLVRFINGHQAKSASMQFSLVGATIDKIEKANESTSSEDGDWFSDWSENDDQGEFAVGDTPVPTASPGTTPSKAPGTTVSGAPAVTTVAPNKTDTNANGTTWNMEMSDKTVLQLKVQDKDNVTHFEFTWPGADEPNDKRELCIYYNDANWYNSYQRYAPEWPMNASTKMPRTPFNYLLDYQNNPQKEEFYMILEHLFINSNGYAIMLDEKAPLFIRRDTGAEPAICISVNNSYPYLENNPDPTYRDIKIKVFAAANVKEVLDFVMKSGDIIPKPTAVPGDTEFTNPKWNVYSIYGQFISRPNLLDFATQIEKQGYWNSEIVLNNQWEAIKGEFKFHIGLFGSAQEMIAKLHSEKFRLKVSVNPIIYDTQANMQAHRSLYVQTVQGQLTYFIDFASEEARGFYEADLKKLHFENGVDSFYVTSDSLRNFHLSDYWMQQTPSLLTKKYIETVAKASPNATTTLAFKTQALPLMVQLSNFQTTPFDQLLKSLIPNVLSVSMAGYSFIIPYHIGGFWPGGKPTEEQYIRMVQACALMPSMSFSWGPWQYSQNAIDITKRMVDLHMQHAPTIIALAKKRMDEGTPIIRPMWYGAPEDERSFTVADQFMLGDDIVVAPVVEIGKRQRSVFLPTGSWTDAHGRVLKGPTIVKVAANLEDLPFFIRKM